MSEVMEPMDSAQPVRRPAPEDVPKFGKGTPMGRPGQPNEVRPGVPVPGVRTRPPASEWFGPAWEFFPTSGSYHQHL